MEKKPDGSQADSDPNRSRIEAFLDGRDEESDRDSVIPSRNGPVFFGRDRASADMTAERIMNRVMHEKTTATQGRTFRIRPFQRIATILAAAALLVLVSSTVTAFFIKLQNVAEITFVLVAPEAKSVSLVGDFNGWSLDSDRLEKKNGDGSWQITVRLSKGRAYNYNFVLDDTLWIEDPKSVLKLDDGMGGVVSSLVL